MKILIIIPTLNEVKSLPSIIKKIDHLKRNLNLLFIDDKSKDGTRQLIKFYSERKKNIKFIFRNTNLGLGAAIKCGLKYAIKNNFQLCITMDADGTHDPKIINIFLKTLNKRKVDIISTNRFFLANSIKKWPLIRIIITKLRYELVKLILRTKLDSSGNFRCYNLNNIKKNDLFISKNNSYFFLIESLFYLEKLKYKIIEIPLYMNPRSFGSSKMRFKHVLLSFLSLIKLKFDSLKY